MSREKALQHGYVRGQKNTATAITVHGIRYPNIAEAVRELKPKASATSILRWIRKGMSPEDAFAKDPKPGFANGIIYKVTQLSTGRLYVGQTVMELDDRWQKHCEDADKGTISSEDSLHHAMRESGKGDFRIEPIAKTNRPGELGALEIRWIDKLRTLYPDGFNLNRGGSSGGSLKQPVDIDGKRFDSHGAGVKYISETRGISISAAKKRLEKGRIDVKKPAKPGESRVKSKEYKAWSLLKDYTSPASKAYLPGVDVHPAWREDFDVWLGEVGTAPTPQHRFVRIDKRLGFVPGNCAWMTSKEDTSARLRSGQKLFNGVQPRHVLAARASK
ncbi:GIY-YIG nuclease family protein [Psychromarinibacter sediminicola]|nr:GIY-YIG nuclease family protein [Psychromarinibacter sediminicola]